MANRSKDMEQDAPEATGTYTVSVYAGNAKLLSEYSLEAEADQITSIDMAESRVRKNLQICKFESVVAVVTEEMTRGFNQVQISVQPVIAEA